ncbi:MAG TPA: TolC family protein, partial [Planctomycetaceae bacterium]|nr:TolC family protein [Planctomycetaceae bacterium]
MTDRLSTNIAQAVLVTLTLLLLVTGCQSGRSHRVASRASRASRALLPESFGGAVSGKQSLVEQTQRPDPVIEQASATEFAEGTHEVRRPAGESAVGRAAEIDFPVTEQAELFDLPEMQPKVLSISALTDANISAARLEERPQLESSAAESSLSFQNAIAISLAQNPDLITARGQDQVSAAAVDVAATYQWNPFVQAQILPADGRGGQTNYYMWLMQRFELAHQLSFREQGANATLNQVRWTIHQTELLNISQTARLYFTALYQQELNELANQTAVLNEDLLGVVERRFEAGVGTAAQVTTAKVAARQSRNQSHLADATYQAALLAIRQQLNLPASEPLKLADRLPAFSWRPANAFCNGVLASAETTGAGSQELANELVEGRS